MLWFRHIKQNTYMALCVHIQIHLGLGLYTSNTLFFKRSFIKKNYQNKTNVIMYTYNATHI